MIAYIIYDAHISPAAQTGVQNMAKAEKLKVVKKENTVIEIMWKPNSIEFTNNKIKFYRYANNT